VSTRTPFTTYLFDLDGTLIDSINLILTCYRHTMRRHLSRVPPDHLWLAGIGTPLRKQLADFTDDAEEVEAMVTTYKEHHREHHDRLLEEYPGALEAVKTIKARGAKMGVVTSKMPWSTHRGLEICGFDGMFDVFVTAEDVTKHKPDPEPVLHAMELLESKPEQTIFVGDSPHDMASGRSAGVQTAAVLWGPFDREQLEPHSPDYWIEKPEDLVEL
jgi:pyrophosphatase PpaX